MTRARDTVTAQRHYTGSVSRLLAYGLDLATSSALFALALAAVSFVATFLFGLGFLGILVQRERRALHALIAGTAVVYAWDARAARLRFLAREAELGRIPPDG